MKSNIFIPKLCKVGFNTRSDTYTGKLGYVIYNDGKVWRKEASWNSWKENYMTPEEEETEKRSQYVDQFNRLARHGGHDGKYRYYNPSKGPVELNEPITWELYEKEFPYDEFTPRFNRKSSDPTIVPIEFTNEALEGFVLNRKAGGNNYSWNPRQTYCRVYDPRGFEIEITIPNLLYILENTNSIKGKGLEGRFIYGWDGKDLILIPEAAPEFEEMLNFTKLQEGSVKKSELKVGFIYIDSSGEEVTYMGEAYEKGWNNNISQKKKLWFATQRHNEPYFRTRTVQILKASTGRENPEFSNYVDELLQNRYYFDGVSNMSLLENPETEILRKITTREEFNGYIKVGNKFKSISISMRYSYNSSNYKFKIIKESIEEFESIKELLEKYTIWEQKMIK